jgi:hypothetical protein
MYILCDILCLHAARVCVCTGNLTQQEANAKLEEAMYALQKLGMKLTLEEQQTLDDCNKQV